MAVSPDGELPFFPNNPPFFLPPSKGFPQYLLIIIAPRNGKNTKALRQWKHTHNIKSIIVNFCPLSVQSSFFPLPVHRLDWSSPAEINNI